MNRTHWKQLLPIIEAFVNGETIEVHSPISDRWIPDNTFVFNLHPNRYRIKPKPSYRPFTPTEILDQLRKVVYHKESKNEWIIHSLEVEAVSSREYRTYVWLRTLKGPGRYRLSTEELLNEYSFACNEPCGVKE